MPFPLIPLIALAASGVGSWLAGRNQAKQQARLNQQASDRAFEQNKQMWELQNTYNTPVAQMQRFGAAGLNPNLIYGQGSPGNAQGAPSYEPPQVPAGPAAASMLQQLPQVLSGYQDFQLKAAQIDNVKAQTDNTHQRTMTEAITRHVKQLQGETMNFDLDRREYLRPYEAAVTANRARASNAVLEQEWSRLRQMNQQEVQQLLDADYARKRLTAVDLDNEKRQADVLYLKYRNDWAKYGIQGSDDLRLRFLIRMLDRLGVGLDSYAP